MLKEVLILMSQRARSIPVYKNREKYDGYEESLLNLMMSLARDET